MMKTVKKIFTLLVLGFVYQPFFMKAQQGGTFTDNLEVPDSVSMEQDFMVDAVMISSGSDNTLIIVAVVVLVIAVAAYFVFKKRTIKT